MAFGRKKRVEKPKSLRRLRKEAKAYLKEIRRILRKYTHKIEPKVVEETRGAAERLQAAREAKDAEGLSRELRLLDEIVEKHLARYKKSTLREYAESIAVAVLIALFLRAFVVEAFKIPSGSMIPTLKVGDHIFVNKFIYGFRVPFTTDPPLKFARIRTPRRGEIIVFLYPQEPDKDFIKRVVAIDGDEVRVKNNTIFLRRRGDSEFREVPRRRIGPVDYCDYDEPTSVWQKVQSDEYAETLDGVTYRSISPASGRADDDCVPVDRFGRCNPELGRCWGCGERVPDNHVFVLGDNRNNSHDSRYWGHVPIDNIKGKAMVTWYSRGGKEENGCDVGVRWDRTFPMFHGVD